MNKSLLFKYATIGLLVLNLALLGYIFFERDKRGAPPLSPGNLQLSAKKEMNLTEEQNRHFLESAERHKRDIASLEEEQASLLKQYFLQEGKNNFSSGQDSLLAAVATIETEKIKLTQRHFAEIRSMLKPEQMESFEDFLQKALGRIFRKGRQRPSPHHIPE